MKCIDENAPDNVLRILVGNKSDLHHRLVVSSHDGMKLADKYHADFYETSAKSETSSLVSEMFCRIAEKLYDSTSVQPQSSKEKIDLGINLDNSMYERVTGCCSLTTQK